MDFLSDEWIAALDAAARDRSRSNDAVLTDVSLVFEQVVTGVRTWQFRVEGGECRVVDGSGEADIQFVTDAETAAAVASGKRSTLDAFNRGLLQMSGDPKLLLRHRDALEALGEIFAEVKARTDFGDC